MTVEQAKSTLLTLARGEIGYAEGNNNYNKYAEDAKITKLFGWNLQNQPWCAVWCSWLFTNAFGYDVGKKMIYQYDGCGGAACVNAKSYFVSSNAFYKTPEVGDIIFYDWNGDGSEDHQGIVESVNGTSITTIEGNYSDSVKRRTLSYKNANVTGFGRPKWALASSSGATASTSSTSSTAASTAATVTTSSASKCDSEMWEALVEKMPVISKGLGMNNPNRNVKALQALLIANGYSLKDGIDGEWGNDTEKQVKAFKDKNGL